MLISGSNFSAWAFIPLRENKFLGARVTRARRPIVFAENYFARPCTNTYISCFYSQFKIVITRGSGRLDWRVKSTSELIRETSMTLSNIFKDVQHIVTCGTENVLISIAIMARNYLPAYNYRRIVSGRGRTIEERSMLFTSLPPQRREKRASIAISRRLHTNSNLHHTTFAPFNYIEMQYKTYFSYNILHPYMLFTQFLFPHV